MLDETVPPADEQMNQYTETPFDERTYDESGNLLAWTDGSTIDYEATYDYRNQMISVFDDVTDETTDYRYDALGRRIERDVDGAVTRSYYFGWRVIEEQDGDDETVATYVYGNYIDEPLQMRRDLGEGMEDFYYHQDDMYNVMALTDAAGAVVERYDYKDYGEPIVYDGNGQVIAGTAYGNPYLFNGRRYDPETGFYYYRTRYLDPKVGRFTSRDTIGIWGDPANLGNGYTYVGNNPWRFLDPFGFCSDSRQITVEQLLDYVEKNDITLTAFHGQMLRQECESGDLLFEIYDGAEYVGCLAQCVKDDPSKLANAALQAGIAWTKDQIKDIAALPAVIAYLITIDAEGNIGIDEFNASEKAIEGLDKLIDAFEGGTADAYGRAQQELYDAIQQYLRDGAGNAKHLETITDNSRRLASRTERVLKRVRQASAAAKAAKCVSGVASKANAAVTVAEAVVELAQQIAIECQAECEQYLKK